MNLQVIVIGHGAAQSIIERHWPLWESHNAPITVFSPSDDKVKDSVKLSGSVCYYGKSAHHGTEAAIRWNHLLNALCSINADFFLIFEYDSFCIDPKSVQLKPGLQGNFRPASHEWISPKYPNFPWLIDRNSLWRMASVQHEYLIEEGGHIDRWFGALGHLGSVPMFDFMPSGFSNDTIRTSELPVLKRAIERGGTMLHGVKSEWCFHFVMEAYAATVAQTEMVQGR